MTIDRAVLAFAGCMILASLALSQVHSPYWLLLTAFVGVNMLQASAARWRLCSNASACARASRSPEVGRDGAALGRGSPFLPALRRPMPAYSKRTPATAVITA